MRKKYQRMSVILILVCMLSSLLLSACSSPAVQEQAAEDLREKLKLAYGYLENMEFDTALDAFAQILEIDEKQVDAYIGIARAASARGRHKEAGDYARKGFEATGNQTLEDMSGMYDQITQKEDLLKEAAALLEKSQADIPEEIGNSRTGLLSETLDLLWETLDAETWSGLSGGYDGAILYPVDADKGIYLVIYPGGYYYLGDVVFQSYEAFLKGLDRKMEEEEDAEKAREIFLAQERDALTRGKREGYGVWAGLNAEEGSAVFYTGRWGMGMPNDSAGFCAVQILPGGSRFVVEGPVTVGLFGRYELTRYSASQYEVLEAVFDGENSSGEENHYFEGQYANDVWDYHVFPFEKENTEEFLMQTASNTTGLYSREFENRRFFELIDKGDVFRASMESLFLARERRHKVPVEGDLLQINGFLCDYNPEHGLYTLRWGGASAVIDNEGRVLFAEYEPDDKQTSLQFTEQGFTTYIFTEPGTENIYRPVSKLRGRPDQNADLDVWQADYDWEGNETGRKYYGKYTDFFFHLRGEGLSRSDARLQAELTDNGVLVKDLDGNEYGRILLDFETRSGGSWQVEVFGRMIRVVYTYGEDKSQYVRSEMFLAPER